MEKFICVGKNYTEHAKELGESIPDNPILFLKPPSVGYTIGNGERGKVTLPKHRGVVHYECEIILLLNAQAQIKAISLGLDMTLRDVQVELKKQGHPWEISKIFKQSAVVGPWIPLAHFPNYLDEPFTFSLNGVVRQNAKGREMRNSPQTCLAHAQEMFPIIDGDIMFTGTPVGVGGVEAGETGEIRWGNRLSYQVIFD